MQKNKNTKLGPRPYQVHQSVSIILKAQVQATSPRSFQTKKRMSSYYNVPSTSVERPVQQDEFMTSLITEAEEW